MQCFALNWLFRIILFFSFFSFHSLHPFGHCLLLSLWKYLFFFFNFVFLVWLSSRCYMFANYTCAKYFNWCPVQFLLLCYFVYCFQTTCMKTPLSFCSVEPFAGSSKTKQKTVCSGPTSILFSDFFVSCILFFSYFLPQILSFFIF